MPRVACNEVPTVLHASELKVGEWGIDTEGDFWTGYSSGDFTMISAENGQICRIKKDTAEKFPIRRLSPGTTITITV